ncbi:MAG TPA: FG-GAP repeat domain-containing protein [Cyclobacteriaceae bacterium]
MFFHDFDQNGTAEQIIAAYNGDESYPLALKHDLIKQMPGLKKKYLKYESFKDQTVFDIFPAEQIERAVKNTATHLQTSIAINNGDGTFELSALPVEAQFSPVYAILTGDFNQDNNIDILLAGNFYNAKPEIGRYDASYGTLFTGDGAGNFSYISNDKSGLKIDGQVREMIPIMLEGKNLIIIGRNNQDVQIIERI